MASKEWAVELRPTELDKMLGMQVNGKIVQGWIDNDAIPNSVIFYGKSGTGKALKNGTKVLTIDGYKPIEQLTLSDLVASTDGKFYPITGIYPQGVKNCYRITFDHNNTIDCSGDHIWTVSRDYGKTYHDETTEEMLAKGITYVEPKTGWVQHKVVLPPVKPLELPEKDLPIDPYLLGCLIGDGSLSNNFSFSSVDPFIIEKVTSILRRDWGMELRKHRTSQLSDWLISFVDATDGRSKGHMKSVKTLSKELASLGMLVPAESKHIPEIYLHSSIEQRRALLAGLMDTDGYVDKTGMSSFTSISAQLVTDVKHLAESLGMVTRVRYDIANWYSVDGQRKSAKPAHYVNFYTRELLCSLPRKRERELVRANRRIRNNIRIISIDKIADADCTCISVAAPNHLFVAENGIPTHNTTLSRAIAHLVGAELVELDAASHNGVDDARQINDLASRLSLTGVHKIFLIDEAHMLTTAAFNALLKNIEEPNPKCHFFWATTDYSKLPNTIKGRSRMLKFYSIPKEELKDYALAVLEYKGYTLKDEVLDIIVSRSYGQVRDMLKLLQTACEGNLNTVEAISKFLAIPDSRGMRTFINAVLTHTGKTGLPILLGINTDLIEWVRALQAHIYELLEDKYGVKTIFTGDNITLRNQIKTVEDRFTDKQFGLLLAALNKITSPDTAFAELYALLFKGVD